MRLRNRRTDGLEQALHEALHRLAAVETTLLDRVPASEIERLNHAFELISEAFEQIAQRAPSSETDRLNHAFELIAGRAPSSEIERLNHAFELLARIPPSGETYLSSLESERVVEVPWALGRYRGEPRVLEIGYAFAEEHYLDLLIALEVPFLVGIDAGVSPYTQLALSFHPVQADVREDCFKPASFDLVLCISTLEHIGRDNSAYGLNDHSARSSPAPDVEAIQIMSNWLAPRGRLLLSVPFGKLEDHGWFINYDRDHLNEVIAASQLTVLDQSFFGWMPGGWRQVEAEVLAERGYRSHGASHAGGVALIELQKVDH